LQIRRDKDNKKTLCQVKTKGCYDDFNKRLQKEYICKELWRKDNKKTLCQKRQRAVVTFFLNIAKRKIFA